MNLDPVSDARHFRASRAIRNEVLGARSVRWGASPRELPDLRLDLLRDWEPGRWYTTLALTVPRFGLSMPDALALDHAWERGALKSASLWWVAPDMVEVLRVAAEQVPGDLTAREVPLPTPTGLVVYAGTIPGLDARTGERTVSVHACVWGPVQTGDDFARRIPAIRMSWYRRLVVPDVNAEPEPIVMDDQGRVPTGRLLGPGLMDPAGPGETVEGIPCSLDDPLVDGVPPDGVAVWMPLGRSDWPLHNPVDNDPFPADYDPLQRAAAADDRRILAATLTIAQQPLVEDPDVVDERPERAAGRRAERAGVPREVARNRIRVVTLRRRGTESGTGAEGHGGRDHDHRWTVSGHWRLQPVGPGRAQRRLTWVRPHIKGPEGAPLKTPDQVNAWRR